MKREPGLFEDTKNLTVIGGSALVAVILTVGLMSARSAGVVRYEYRFQHDVAEAVSYDIEMGPVSGSNRLYGTVATRDGAEYTGFIRWDKNEGSWADLLDATKISDRGSSATLSGVRFGNVHRIEATGSNSARFVLKTGEVVRMNARATDLGTGMRGLIVALGHEAASLDWRNLDYVEFFPAPDDARAYESRMYGTVTTASGQTFTGYVTWDIDEIYSSDVLDGEADGVDHEIPFGAIASIERYSNRAARVTLTGGDEIILSGTNDVDASNSGITVSDVGLGQVKMDWSEFDHVRFHQPDTEPGYGLFDGGPRLTGTVITRTGQELSGEISWDRDESFAWEMLNGSAQGVEFNIEFGNIARISKTAGGAMVELRDGRVFELHDSNDVDSGNRGIRVSWGGAHDDVEWRDFAELRLTR